MLKTISLAGLLSLAFSATALAQTSPGLFTGQVPSASQWNGFFSGKLDNVAPGSATRGGVFAQPGYVDATGLGSAANVSAGTGVATALAQPLTGPGSLVGALAPTISNPTIWARFTNLPPSPRQAGCSNQTPRTGSRSRDPAH